MKQANFEMSVDARLLKQRLEKVKVDEVINYTDLSKEISRPVKGSSGCLQTARRSLFNSSRILFAAINGVGLKRLSDNGKIDASDLDVRKVRRAARRGAKKLASIDSFEKLTPAKQLAHTAKLSVLTAVAHIATDKQVTAIEGAVSGRANELPIAETLRFMMPKN